jgi:hypothetical protein
LAKKLSIKINDKNLAFRLKKPVKLWKITRWYWFSRKTPFFRHKMRKVNENITLTPGHLVWRDFFVKKQSNTFKYALVN